MWVILLNSRVNTRMYFQEVTSETWSDKKSDGVIEETVKQKRLFDKSKISKFEWSELHDKTINILVFGGCVFARDVDNGNLYLLAEPRKRKNTVKGNRTSAASKGNKN